ncbi:transcription factor HFR1 isoform X1 [Raphanus sativus]|uniref:Transcription factor HFR1 isoform X1 n=2 Tax=Raphanus sativus TaxID=3726 RepID=A0A6J0NEN2_RAPSA|nr:transcription factor HFR1 isoform X1 [Raphanus sativus]
MLNKQGFMEGWNNDVGSLAVKDQGTSERARSDEKRLITGLKSSYGYVDHDQADIQFQIVPEIHKEEEKSEKDLMLAVPDEHSETGDHHDLQINGFSDSSDNQYYSRNKHDKLKRRSLGNFSDDESEGFTREVPTVTIKGFKKRRRDDIDMMSNKMHTLQQLLPNCHKEDTVSVLDTAIEYMKDLQFQLQVMSIMRMNRYFALATLNLGMHNDLVTAMAMAQGINLMNQTTSPPLIPTPNWPLPPFSNIPFPHTAYQSLFPTTALPASSTQCVCGLAPCFPSFLDFSSRMMGGRQ